ncbi:MAG: orotate phosphoribosyltransferase [Candidatus Caenarcaniphilales bacterium]|nr:orotate phosphoribosyltransferase [Candidatus Caenarcaniphilales bacterium]
MLKESLKLDFSQGTISKARARLAEILKEQSIFRGNFVLASGQKSDYYLDARRTTLSPEGVSLVSYLILSMVQPTIKNVDGIAGPSIGADPIVSGVSQMSYLSGKPLKAGYIRKEVKKHGRNKMVEGPLEKNDNVILLEDVVTTGTSSLQALNSLKKHGCNVNHVISIILREEIGKELLEIEGKIQFHYIYRASELLD